MAEQNIAVDNENRIYNWLQEGWSGRKISKELGCSTTTIYRFLNIKGWKSQHKSKRNDNNLLKDKFDEVIKLHKSGLSCNKIGKILGHTGSNVVKLLKKNGVEIKDHYYNVDDTFFDAIDSEAKAYVLGWFYSDGCVDLKGKMRIQIQAGDVAILHVIKKLMGYDGPLYNIPPPKKNPHRKSQVCLCINRKKLADKLIKLGCVPNKSLKVTMPTKKQVPEKFFSHFIRGVFDGDGSLTINKGKYPQTSLMSTDDFLQPLRTYLLKNHNVETKHYYKTAHTNTMSMFTCKTEHSIRYLNWLYHDATFYLSRKKHKFDKYLEDVYNKV